MDDNFKTNWDPTNDYSRENLEISEDTLKITELIPVYVDDKLVWGKEPESDLIINGDVNQDKKFSLLDILLLQKYIVNAADLNESQLKAADVISDEKVNIFDLAELKNMLLK